jgi:nuclear transport factor 2 (NTF2) superfamily protein
VRDAARRWALTWQRAWEARDVEPIVALYRTDAVFSTQPFRDPYRGRDGVRAYVTRVFGEERDPRVWVGEPIVDGDRAAVEWWAAVTEDGSEITLSGVSVLRFDNVGLVLEQSDAWNQVEGRREPPAGWGGRVTTR